MNFTLIINNNKNGYKIINNTFNLILFYYKYF